MGKFGMVRLDGETIRALDELAIEIEELNRGRRVSRQALMRELVHHARANAEIRRAVGANPARTASAPPR